jgi:hypothetical protein
VRRSEEAENDTDEPILSDSDKLETRVIDGKKYRCTAAEFRRIHAADVADTRRQQTLDFLAQSFPYALSAMGLLAGILCILTGHAESAHWLWGGAGIGTGGSVTAAGIRHVGQKRAAAKSPTRRGARSP